MPRQKLKVIKAGDVFRWDFGHGEELVQCAGQSPLVPGVIGFHTVDDGLFVVPEKDLAKKGLRYE